MSRTMKDSGIPWIGEIPERWNISRLKSIGYLYGGLSGKSGDDFKVNDGDKYAFFIPFINIWNNLYVDKENLNRVKIKPIEKQNKVLYGDILFLMSSEDYDGIGKTALLNFHSQTLYLNSFCKGLRITNKNVHPRYLNYLLTSSPYRSIIMNLANGFIRINLRAEKLSVCPILIPPLSEQQKIADYLDRKCSEIDEMIALEEKVIEELKAYKQSVITEAVTKGLNPDVPMKDCGIEWIGKIPERWSVLPFKVCYKMFKGLNITKENLISTGYPVISYGQIHSKQNTGTGITGNLFRFISEDYLQKNPDSLSKKFDLFFADTSEDREGVGNAVFIDTDKPVFAGYHTIIARPSRIAKSKYFAYQLQTDVWRFQLRKEVSGIKVFSISQKLLNKTFLIVPTSKVQDIIADYLDQKCSEIDSLISIKLSKIDNLKEYKKSIIYEYVTGKREVNE